MKVLIASLSLLTCFLLMITTTGCKKQGPTGCVITAKDVDNTIVVGANIYLHAKDVPPPIKKGDFEYNAITDSEGKAYFDIPLEAIYTIEATKDSTYGWTTVRLIKDKSVEVSVILE
jgi:hypothetical protein